MTAPFGGGSLILIVDDRDAVRYVTERTIRAAGFRTAEAACGEEAVRLVRELRPDLVLLDVDMPDIDGYEVCRRIREDESTASVAVVMVSATFESAEHRVRGLEGGADTFLVAPVEPPVLVATVRAMLRMRRAEAQLREFDRRKDEFLATLAHELRNPLAPLLYCIELLEGGAGEAVRKRTLSMMRRQSEHLVRLVDDLVDMSRITQNKLTLRFEPITLQQVIGTAVEARGPELEAKQQVLSVDLPEQPIPLHADPVRLAQVFGNLLSNSIKYTGAGGRISIAAQVDADHVTVAVTDNGIGIRDEDLDRVFGLFVQAGKPAGGLGIGLALVQRIVTMHNGTIKASSPGCNLGSTFEVKLPLSALETERVPSESRDADSSTAPLKVLVVDDNVDSADSMAQLLRLMNHDVRPCYRGRAGLEIARVFLPDVVFVDVTMPDIDGYATVAEMRREPWSHGKLICTLSGHGQAEDKRRSAAAGADMHLVKPLGRLELERILAASAPTRMSDSQ